MNAAKISAVFLIALGLTFSSAIAAKDLPVDRGKALFKDSKAFGGKRACSECHPEGKGLEAAGGKMEFHIMGRTQKSLEEAVNVCIENASMGKPIDPNSAKMKDLVAYIKSLKKRGGKSPGY